MTPLSTDRKLKVRARSHARICRRLIDRARNNAIIFSRHRLLLLLLMMLLVVVMMMTGQVEKVHVMVVMMFLLLVHAILCELLHFFYVRARL